MRRMRTCGLRLMPLMQVGLPKSRTQVVGVYAALRINANWKKVSAQ